MYIFSARALASCRRRPLSSNVRQHKATVRLPSGKCACRRELNNHGAAKPRSDRLLSLRPPRRIASEQTRIEVRLCQFLGRRVSNRSRRGKSSAARLGAAVPNWTSGLRGKHWSSVSSSGHRWPQRHPRPEHMSRRLEYEASQGQQRGAGSFSAGQHKMTRPWQARRLWLYCAERVAQGNFPPRPSQNRT